jgi:hypothetical protein
LTGFTVSAENKQFKTAIAAILNDSTIAVKSGQISAPVAVRYAWARNPVCNLYNSEDIPATPFRSDMWKLSSYSLPQTSCTLPNVNSRLVSIKVNGVAVENFDPERLNYQIDTENLGAVTDVIAVADNPFAALTVNKTDNKITVSVTAESGSARTYEINLKGITGVKKDAVKGIEISRNNNAIIIQNTENEDYKIKIFNPAGQCLVSDFLGANCKKRHALNEGVYLIQLTDSSKKTKTIKYFNL